MDAKLYDSYRLEDDEFEAVANTAMMSKLMNNKLVVVTDRTEVENLKELISKVINNTWYMNEDMDVGFNTRMVVRLYFYTSECKNVAKEAINAEISGKGLTG